MAGIVGSDRMGSSLLVYAIVIRLVAATIGTEGPIEEPIGKPSPEDTAFVGAASRILDGLALNDGSTNLVLSAKECIVQCYADLDCNIWQWCGSVDGCVGPDGWEKDKSRYRQCWLMTGDTDSAHFPETVEPRQLAVGWMSGTVRRKDTFGPDRTFSGVTCKNKWWGWDGQNSLEFLEGTCAAPGGFGPQCIVQDGSTQSCPEQACKVLIDAEFHAQKVLVSGENLYTDSAERCCYKCKSEKGCTVWSWCSLFFGCGNRGLKTFRQCWLWEEDASQLNFPMLKQQGKSAEGWISGYVPGYIIWKS